MSLSTDLISQFVKITKDDKKEAEETTVYGTIVKYDNGTYVKLDGSDLLTPVTATADAKDGERVTVMIKNHTATVNGNISSPAARTGTVTEIGEQVTALDSVVANKLDATEANITFATIGNLEATNAEITNLKADKANITDLEATNAEITNLNTNKANITDLDATNAEIINLNATYATIDFANIGDVAMNNFYSKSGLIEEVTVSEGTITGQLVGVTIKGDLIEANTLKADKLVIKGEDGLYYKLNTSGDTNGDGVLDEDELKVERDVYTGIDGTIIIAKSVTAEKVSVDDLVAFDATIGGFHIGSDSIYSDVKDSIHNTTRGIYMDTDGQFNFGDANNHIQYYKTEDGTYKLAISAESITYALNGSTHSLSDLGKIGEYVTISTYEDEPCIELGENDSDFKLIITNTKILFKQGSSTPAYISNQALNIDKAVIENELQIGDKSQNGEFVWKVRSNGNLGLQWRG